MPTILVGLHTALIALISIAVANSSDTEAVMAWIFPYYLDYPASQLIRFFGMTSDAEQPVFYFILGFVYWGLIGILIQSTWRWFSRRSQANEDAA